jgi:hypothetical protein
MSQRKPRAEAKSLKSVSAGHDANNLRTAREILESPNNWNPGMVNWARRVVERLSPETVSRENV